MAQDAPSDKIDFKGVTSESLLCVDCNVNVAPGWHNRADLEDAARALGPLWKTNKAGIEQTVGRDSEIYMVRNAVWKEAGMEPYGGCLCVGCLEKRIGRRLEPKDFDGNHCFNKLPGTRRLLNRRGR
jgi:hypothetical protein